MNNLKIKLTSPINLLAFICLISLLTLYPKNSKAANCTDDATEISENCDGDFQMTGNNTTHTLNSGVTINDTNGSATRFSGNSNIFNVFGTITTGSSDYGVQFQSGSNNTVNVKSSGSVSTRHDAVNAGSDASDITINNEGTISTSGVRTISVTGVANVTISNSGTISGPEEQISLSDESGGMCMMMPGSCDSTTGVAITNSGTIDSTGNIAGSNGAIRVLGATVTSITNTGNINGTGNSIYIRDNGSGTDGTIATLTNTGTMEGTIKAHLDGFVTTLINDQGKENSNPLAWDTNIPTNTQIKINSVSDFGQLAVSNVNGTTTFSIASGSSVVHGTYSNVITGVAVSNFTGSEAPSGTYGDCTWSLNNSSGNNWDLVASCDTDSPTIVISAAEIENGATTENSSLSITFTSSESTSNFVLADITLSNATLSNFSGSGASYSATLVPTAKGQVTISISAGVYTDAAGNGNLVATQFVWNYFLDPLNVSSHLNNILKHSTRIAESNKNTVRSISKRLNKLKSSNLAFSDQGIKLAYAGDNQFLGEFIDAANRIIDFEIDPFSTWKLWTAGEIGYGRTNNTSLQVGSDITVNNILLGTDKQLSKDYLIGFSIDRDDRKSEFSNSSSQTETKTITISNYHSFKLDSKHYLDFIINYSDIDIDYYRASSGNKYYGDRKAESIVASISYSQVFDLNNFSFTPNIQYEHGLTIFEEFSESPGTESLFLARQHVNLSSMKVSLQANALENYEILLSNTYKLIVKPYATIAYSQNLNRGSLISASYLSNPGIVYSIKQPRTFNNSQNFNLGLNMNNDKNVTSLIEFNRTDNSEGDWENSLILLFRVNF